MVSPGGGGDADGLTGRAFVIAGPEGRHFTATSGIDGRLAARGLAPGAWTLTEHGAKADQAVSIEVIEGENLQLELVARGER